MGSVNLPPGFRFYPSDEELVVHFLHRKAALLPCHPDVIPDLDLFPYDPWQLDGKALSEGKQWYYYSRKTQNRITDNGYWKPMAGRVEEPVLTSDDNEIVGMKKYFLFYTAEGIKTNWVMEEYRLSEQCTSASTRSSKTRGRPKQRDCDEEDSGPELSCLDEVFLSLDDLDEISKEDLLLMLSKGKSKVEGISGILKVCEKFVRNSMEDSKAMEGGLEGDFSIKPKAEENLDPADFVATSDKEDWKTSSSSS
ncbi:unnamed protein product [Dovyalis caffra]|uniref:NAC domain-containing protein n=1 Tax=Dovyalis caffra TaxID=77055 RepID=A0AAV1SSH4_9ROSI|nr:unnamed protein product [Dovyalis caffra]